MSRLLISQDGAVTRVTLNRPEVRNAFDDALVGELAAWADSVGSGGPARVAILSGAGKAFCAGGDIAWMSRMAALSEEENIRDARAAASMFQSLDALPIPLIGRIHGAALGGGAGLAAICDIAVSADDAVFGFTEAKLGIVPGVISPFAIAKIGRSAARELFLTAERFSAVRAHQIGLVHHVVPEADLDTTIDALVRELLTSAPGAIAEAKALIRAVAGQESNSVAEITAHAIARRRVSPEGQAGMRAFMEKRKAPWVE